MNILSFYKRKILISILFCAFFALGIATLLLHNAAIRDEAAARRMEEKRDVLERVVLSHESAYVRFSLNSLRTNALEMGLVPIDQPRFVYRGKDKPSFAFRNGE